MLDSYTYYWSTPVNTGQHRSTPVNTGQHWSTPVNTSQHRSTPVNIGLHQSTLVNTGQHQSTPGNTSQHRSTPVNTIQRRSTPVNTGRLRSKAPYYTSDSQWASNIAPSPQHSCEFRFSYALLLLLWFLYIGFLNYCISIFLKELHHYSAIVTSLQCNSYIIIVQ